MDSFCTLGKVLIIGPPPLWLNLFPALINADFGSKHTCQD